MKFKCNLTPKTGRQGQECVPSMFVFPFTQSKYEPYLSLLLDVVSMGAYY